MRAHAEQGLLIFASRPFGLISHGRFIGMDIVCRQQFLSHRNADKVSIWGFGSASTFREESIR